METRYIPRLSDVEGIEVGLVDIELFYGNKDIEVWNNEGKLSFVGAGISNNIGNTKELKVMNYHEVMKRNDADCWIEEIEKEKDRFEKYNCFTIIDRKNLQSNMKVMSTTWAMKQKASRKLCGRLNAWGYEQLEGQHYYADSIFAPVNNPNTIQILLMPMCMNPKWKAEIVDVEGAFLQGKFKNGEEMYIDVPDRMEKFYGD